MSTIIYTETIALISVDLGNKVSIYDLIEILGIDEVYAKAFLNGEITLTDAELNAILDAKGITYEDLPVEVKLSTPTGSKKVIVSDGDICAIDTDTAK